MKRLASVALGLALGLGLVACVGGQPAGAQALPRHETFSISGQQWGPPTNFNPVHPNPGWPVSRTQNMTWIYESLFAYNMVTGEMEPLLAETMEWADPSLLSSPCGRAPASKTATHSPPKTWPTPSSWPRGIP